MASCSNANGSVAGRGAKDVAQDPRMRKSRAAEEQQKVCLSLKQRESRVNKEAKRGNACKVKALSENATLSCRKFADQ